MTGTYLHTSNPYYNPQFRLQNVSGKFQTVASKHAAKNERWGLKSDKKLSDQI